MTSKPLPQLKTKEPKAKPAQEIPVSAVPTGWRILIRDHGAKEVTKGGIIIPEQSKDDTATLNFVGEVLELGPDCYKHPKFIKGEPWCKVGDFILFGRYAGVKFQFSGSDTFYRLVNDDEVLAVISDMDLVKVYV